MDQNGAAIRGWEMPMCDQLFLSCLKTKQRPIKLCTMVTHYTYFWCTSKSFWIQSIKQIFDSVEYGRHIGSNQDIVLRASTTGVVLLLYKVSLISVWRQLRNSWSHIERSQPLLYCFEPFMQISLWQPIWIESRNLLISGSLTMVSPMPLFWALFYTIYANYVMAAILN